MTEGAIIAELGQRIRRLGTGLQPTSQELQHMMYSLQSATDLDQAVTGTVSSRFETKRSRFLQITALCSLWLRKCRHLSKAGKECLLNTTPSLPQLADRWFIQLPRFARNLYRQRPVMQQQTSFTTLFPMAGLSLELGLLTEDQRSVRTNLYEKASGSSSMWNREVLKALVLGNRAPSSKVTSNIVSGRQIGSEDQPLLEKPTRDVLELQHELQLNDPLSLTRQVTPCRGWQCCHLDTFDLTVFLMYCRQEVCKAEKQLSQQDEALDYNDGPKATSSGGLTYDLDDLYSGSGGSTGGEFKAKTSLVSSKSQPDSADNKSGHSVTFKCPLCSKAVDLMELYVDPYVQHILSNVSPLVRSVLVHSTLVTAESPFGLGFEVHTEVDNDSNPDSDLDETVACMIE